MVKVNKNEFRVGLLLIVPIVVIVLFVIVKFGYSIAGRTIDVYLKVDSISALKNGTAVKMKGYTLGRVVDLQPYYEPDLYFLATLRLKADVKLSENCTAVIQNQNIVGNPIINIKNSMVKGKFIQNGDVIEGIEYVNLESVLQDVHLLLSSLTDTVGVIKKISVESRRNIRTLGANLANSMASLDSILKGSKADILATLKSFRQTAIVLNQISKELKKHPMSFILSGKDEDKKKSK